MADLEKGRELSSGAAACAGGGSAGRAREAEQARGPLALCSARSRFRSDQADTSSSRRRRRCASSAARALVRSTPTLRTTRSRQAGPSARGRSSSGGRPLVDEQGDPLSLTAVRQRGPRGAFTGDSTGRDSRSTSSFDCVVSTSSPTSPPRALAASRRSLPVAASQSAPHVCSAPRPCAARRGCRRYRAPRKAVLRSARAQHDPRRWSEAYTAGAEMTFEQARTSAYVLTPGPSGLSDRRRVRSVGKAKSDRWPICLSLRRTDRRAASPARCVNGRYRWSSSTRATAGSVVLLGILAIPLLPLAVPGAIAYGAYRIVRSISRRRSGSASRSISTILPPETVNPATAKVRPSRTTTNPAAPLT